MDFDQVPLVCYLQLHRFILTVRGLGQDPALGFVHFGKDE